MTLFWLGFMMNRVGYINKTFGFSNYEIIAIALSIIIIKFGFIIMGLYYAERGE